MRTRKIRTTFQWKYEINMLELAFGFGDGEAASDDYDCCDDGDDDVMNWWCWGEDDDVDDNEGPDDFDTDIYRCFFFLLSLTKLRVLYKVMASYNGRIW